MNPEEPPTFILRSRRVVTPDGVRDTAILVSRGTIAAVGEHMPSDLPLVDVDDAVVSPGLFDPHVHINEPGRAGMAAAYQGRV